jgi:hypothetical protein
VNFKPSQIASLLFLLLLGATWLRIPHLYDNLGFHPDERGMVMISQSVTWEQLKPESFHYGSFNFYLVFFASQFAGLFDKTLSEYNGIYYVGRSIALFASILAILGTYFLSLSVFRRKNDAIISAFFLACVPLHIQLSRFFTVDILLTTICTWILVFSCELIRKRNALRLATIGVLCAAAITTKISALSIGLPVLLAVYLSNCLSPKPFEWIVFVRNLITIGLLCFIGILLFEPYLLIDPIQVYTDNMRQITMVRGEWRAPYTLQYEGTPPFLYHIEQMAHYAVGWPMSILISIGLAACLFRILKGRFSAELICLLWVLVVFASVGGLYVKFPRYLLPIYPALCIFGAHGTMLVFKSLRRYLPRMVSKGALLSVLSLILIRALAWHQLYNQPHTWMEASSWMFEQFESDSTILEIHWDDSLPKSVPGHSRSGYKFVSLPLYEPESSKKYEDVCLQLSSGDYLVLPSTRFYGAMKGAWREYPYSSHFLRQLFSGQLGWEIRKEFFRYPELGPFTYPDHTADESLRVYDHPRVLVFENSGRLSIEQCTDLLTKSQYLEKQVRPDFDEIFGL